MFVVRAPLLLALGLAVGMTACSDPGPGSGTDEGGADEAEALRLGRVHVVVSAPTESEPEADANPDGFELTARFAVVRGLDEEFVRARADMPDLLEDLLNPGQCAAESALWPAALEPDNVELGQELVLVDAGDFEVQLGSTRIEVPLALVPDLLPYMSGVEYGYFAEEAPEAESITVAAAGGLGDELPAFTVDASLPPLIGLQPTADGSASAAALETGALVLRWTADDSGSTDPTIALRLTPTLGSEPVGDDILCLVSDRGQTRLDLAELHTLGLARDADALRVEASRARASLFDVGAWAGTEFVVERRETSVVPLR